MMMADEQGRYRSHKPHHIASSDYNINRQLSSPISSPTNNQILPIPTAATVVPTRIISDDHSQTSHGGTTSPTSTPQILPQHHPPLPLPLLLSSSSSNASPYSNVSRPHKIVADYKLTKTLGQGSMGKVKLAIHLVTGEKRACKIIPRPPGSIPYSEPIYIGPTKSICDFPAADDTSMLSSSKLKSAVKQAEDAKNDKEIRIIREAAIMLLLRHPHICALYDVVLLDEFYYMFFEYVNGGQLLDYIISHGKLKEKNSRRFVRQIVSAVDYCHQNSIVHRDLKIENVLIDSHGNIKLIDFGLSNLYSPESQLQTFCGSLYFAAPELLNAKAYTGPEVDVWSLGIILYVLVCGRVPFDDTSMPVLHSKIKAGHVEFPSHVSNEYKHLISRMLVTHPSQRASMLEVKTHPWLVKGYDGPPDNYLPARPRLTLPLDSEVIERMKGFEFGSSEHIIAAIEDQITRGEQLPVFGGGGGNRAPVTPLINIYHLVKEKINRDQDNSLSTTSSSKRWIDSASTPRGEDERPTTAVSMPQNNSFPPFSAVDTIPIPSVDYTVSKDQPVEPSNLKGSHIISRTTTSLSPLCMQSNIQALDNYHAPSHSHNEARESSVLRENAVRSGSNDAASGTPIFQSGLQQESSPIISSTNVIQADSMASQSKVNHVDDNRTANSHIKRRHPSHEKLKKKWWNLFHGGDEE